MGRFLHFSEWAADCSKTLFEMRRGHVAELVGIEGGVVSGVINLESSGA